MAEGDLNKLKSEDIKSESIIEGIETTRTGYGAFMFSSFSIGNLSDFFTGSLGTFVAHPLSFLFSGMKTAFSLRRTLKARNQNAGMLTNLLIDIGTTALIGIVTIGGFAGSLAIGAVAPFLMIAALGISTAYNLTMLLISAYKWSTTKDVKSREKYKQDFVKYLISSALAGAITTGAVLLMAFHVMPVIIGAITAGTCGVGFVLGAIATYKTWKKAEQVQEKLVASDAHLRQTVKQKLLEPNPTRDMEKVFSQLKTTHAASHHAVNQLPIKRTAVPIASTTQEWNFYYREHRAEKFDTEFNGDIEKYRLYLIQEATNQIQHWRNLLYARQQKSWFGKMIDLISFQAPESTLIAKLEIISAIRALLLNQQEIAGLEAKLSEGTDHSEEKKLFEVRQILNNKNIHNLEQLMNDSSYKKYFSQVFQSTRKDVGDTEDFFEGAELFFKAQQHEAQVNRDKVNKQAKEQATPAKHKQHPPTHTTESRKTRQRNVTASATNLANANTTHAKHNSRKSRS